MQLGRESRPDSRDLAGNAEEPSRLPPIRLRWRRNGSAGSYRGRDSTRYLRPSGGPAAARGIARYRRRRESNPRPLGAKWVESGRFEERSPRVADESEPEGPLGGIGSGILVAVN